MSPRRSTRPTPAPRPTGRQLTLRQLDAILAALRLAQGDMQTFHGMPHFVHGRPLSKHEMDTLCEHLNCGIITRL